MTVQLGGNAYVHTTDGAPGAWELVSEVHALLSSHHISRAHRFALALPHSIWITAYFILGGIAIRQTRDDSLARNVLVGVILVIIWFCAHLLNKPRADAKKSASVLTLRRNELRMMSLQQRSSLNASLVSGVVLAVVGVPLGVALAWLTNFFGLKD
ncbi:hypothetical protein [Streptomyces lydicus]|uniref:hypothetical protein n=1 Tax=Streptomyces lydicus TaxID=47763 RepID=UPI0037B8946C